jgi:hypothetical protein
VLCRTQIVVVQRSAPAGFVTEGFVAAGFVTEGFVTEGFVTEGFVTGHDFSRAAKAAK